MKNPILPCFHIPDSFNFPEKKVSPEFYQEWVESNIRLLQEKGLYREYRKDELRIPVNARFHI